MYCENCGSPLPDTARFCGKCGTAVSPPLTAVAPAALSPAPPRVTPPPPPPVYAVPPAPVTRPPPPPAASPRPPVPPPPYPAGAYIAPTQAQAAHTPPLAAWQPPPASPANPQQTAPQTTNTGLVPPNMHWLIVFILSAITYGLGGLIWAFKQAFFVKKLDPGSKGVLFFACSAAAMVAQVAVYFVAVGAGMSGDGIILLAVILMLNLIIVVFAFIGIFGMRTSLENYYGTVEPIGLRLSKVMTFFFSILYFQYHFSRIAAWKKTGILK